MTNSGGNENPEPAGKKSIVRPGYRRRGCASCFGWSGFIGSAEVLRDI